MKLLLPADIVDLYARHKSVAQLLRLLSASEGARSAAFVEGLAGSSLALVLAAVMRKGVSSGSPIVVVMRHEEEAAYLYQDLCTLVSSDASADDQAERVLFFPSPYRRAVKYGNRDAGATVVRTQTTARMAQPSSASDGLLLITYPEALAVSVSAASQWRDLSVALQQGQTIEPDALLRTFADAGMTRRDYVYEPGDYAVRGSIVDVFSYGHEQPFRLDFFGDEIDTIRSFDVETQLSDARFDNVVIVTKPGENQGVGVNFLSLLPDDAVVAWRDIDDAFSVVNQIAEAGFVRQSELAREAEPVADDDASLDQLTAPSVFRQQTERFTPLYINKAPAALPKGVKRIAFATRPVSLFHKQFQLLTRALADAADHAAKVCITASNPDQHQRLAEVLAATSETHYHYMPVLGELHEGFEDYAGGFCLYTDHEIFDRFHRYTLRSEQARAGKVARAVKEMTNFESGDYVTHIDHGVGRFVGLVRIEQPDGREQEMMKLVYAGGDIVYVSIHSLAKVSKYRGQDAAEPRLSRLGTGAWDKMKSRTKKKIKDIARELIALYAYRRQEKGFAFAPDDYMQHELEAGFIYEDTPDQQRVMAEVKHDMESARPMDRLVCGDVGFGKTEIAVRAAFKAAISGKQTAVLVPTTILAYQHYQTFSERLKGFPVRVDYLSRARTAAQSRDVCRDLAEGKIDIIIGTHKLIGKQVKFHDLGLLIIDEEQKFGVSVKEKLRQLRHEVDTLTLSATPIPRTLQFSLMGARDLSVLQTPPPNRRPIHTEVHRFGHEVIQDAIEFEMSRSGQVFFVCNSIAKLVDIQNLIRKHVPDARVVVGHGQMPPEQLERVLMDFIHYEYDVLLSTTIVENGIDIPNANTIIIDNAHHFGLSDLHQMRGRVGRSQRKAFCYLLAPPPSLLTDEARRRMEAIEAFSDLGSGIQIAMQDLDIRGAGNLLGAEQSGFIADLGAETYQKILAEAVNELRVEEFPELQREEADVAEADAEGGKADFDLNYVSDCAIDTDLPLFFSEQYVPGASERMALYKRLSALRTDDEVEAFATAMKDRFGPLPVEAQGLLKVVGIRRMGLKMGIERMLIKRGRLTLYFVQNPDSPFYQSAMFGRILTYVGRAPQRCTFGQPSGKPRLEVSHVDSLAEASMVLRSMMSSSAAGNP